MAVNIYPHQSKSVVLVDHSAKPSESSSLEQYKSSAPNIPVVVTTDANGGLPATPPQQFSVDDVDSPLRNPRAPPKPPAINFIPATPSGLTPTTEKQKQQGNYFEMTAEKPKRSMSLLKRALTRRTTDYGPSPARPVGLLTRTFSLSRNIRRRDERPRLRRRASADSLPPDETRLHPHWRPAYAEDERCDCCSHDDDEDEYDEYDEDHDRHDRRRRRHEDEDDEGEDRTYRYPPIDNRPAPLSPSFSFSAAAPRRRLSERIKRTFAILPLRDDGGNGRVGYGDGGYDDDYDRQYPATAHDAPDRRTIRRTPSGNLRVMKFRRSMESLTRGGVSTPPLSSYGRPGRRGNGSAGVGVERRYTRLWRSLSLKARSSLRRASSIGGRDRGDFAGGGGGGSGGGGGFLPTLGDRINIPRRLSERRREKRTQELRGMISGPREVRDGVGDVIRRNSWRERDQHPNPNPSSGDADALYVLEQQRERRLVRGGVV
jgi:uncharacterized membrane protein YgcG